MLVSLCNSTCKLLLYCPPSSPASVFETLYFHLLGINVNSFSNFVLLGDFNVNYNNSSHPLFANLCTNIVLIVFHLPKLYSFLAQVVQAHLLIWLSFPVNLVCAAALRFLP